MDADGPVTSCMIGRSFLDTNIAVYLFDAHEPAKQARARSVIRSADTRGNDLVVSTQVLSEFYVTVTRKLHQPLDAARAARAVEYLARFEVVTIDKATVRLAIETSQAAQLSYWDALIVESAAGSGCVRLLSEDLATGRTIRGVSVQNPLAEH